MIRELMSSKVLLAELMRRPSANAVTVAITPAPSFTTACHSLPELLGGRSRCRQRPTRAPPNMHATLRPAIIVEDMNQTSGLHKTYHETAKRAIARVHLGSRNAVAPSARRGRSE